VNISDLKHNFKSKYDSVFLAEDGQQEVYEFVKDAPEKILQGFNCTIFAYGQTGSGKTFTMFGPESNHLNYNEKKGGFDKELLGITPRAIQGVFSKIQATGTKCTIYCSFLQIYNEKLYDLLQDINHTNPLNVREDKYTGIYVDGLTEYVVTNMKDCLLLLKRGEKNRVKRSTKMNISSSRSHSIFQLLIETD